MNSSDVKALAGQVTQAVREFVARSETKLLGRIEQSEQRTSAVEAALGELSRTAASLREQIQNLSGAVAALPKPVDGKDGRDGKDADEDAIVARVLAQIPVPKDGRDGKDVDLQALEALIEAKIAALPKPADGKDGRDGVSVHPDTVARMVAEAVAALPRPQDGAPGRDAAEIQVLASLDESRRYRRGTWASYRGGLLHAVRDTDPLEQTSDLARAGWDVVVEGVAGIVVSQEENPRKFSVSTMLTSGVRAVSEFSVPVMLYHGVWREREYERGDNVTWNGSVWICRAERTTEKPGQSSDWQLAVKEGARGKDGRDGNAPAPKAPVVRVK